MQQQNNKINIPKDPIHPYQISLNFINGLQICNSIFSNKLCKIFGTRFKVCPHINN